MRNTLHYGDCLNVMAGLPDSCVDLIYLDPPFNSKSDYNCFFPNPENKPINGGGSPHLAQIIAFHDTWTWDGNAKERVDNMTSAVAHPAHKVMKGLQIILGETGALAYLSYMAERLTEMKRLLKPTGSIYLHCDPTMSHYLKSLMDDIFGVDCFANEIVWQRQRGAKGDATQYGRNSDRLLFYVKSENYIFTPPRLKNHNPKTIKDWYNKTDQYGKYVSRPLTAAGGSGGDSGKPWRGRVPTGHWTVPNLLQNRYEKRFEKKLIGSVRERLDILADAGMIDFTSTGNPSWRRYLHEATLPRIHDIWNDDDVRPISRTSKERLGYPTQKPISLLERIINASSNEGDVILDPFCGCGTTIEAAHKLNRSWIGIDISPFTVDLIEKRRMKGIPIEVQGVPQDLSGAQKLAQDKPFDFERWAVCRIPGLVPNDKQVGDGGIDGRGLLLSEPDDHDSRLVLAQTKGGKFNASALRDFLGVIERNRAAMGVYITLNPVTSTQAHSDAISLGNIKYGVTQYPRAQLWSIHDHFKNQQPNMPPLADPYTGKEMQLSLL